MIRINKTRCNFNKILSPELPRPGNNTIIVLKDTIHITTLVVPYCEVQLWLTLTTRLILNYSTVLMFLIVALPLLDVNIG